MAVRKKIRKIRDGIDLARICSDSPDRFTWEGFILSWHAVEMAKWKILSGMWCAKDPDWRFYVSSPIILIKNKEKGLYKFCSTLISPRSI